MRPRSIFTVSKWVSGLRRDRAYPITPRPTAPPRMAIRIHLKRGLMSAWWFGKEPLSRQGTRTLPSLYMVSWRSAMNLDAIEWGEPVLPRGNDGELEAEARKAVGSAPGVLMHVVSVPWVGRAVIVASRKLASEAPDDLLDVARFVTACESLCRYSYGVARANLRLHGYADGRVGEIEEDRLDSFDERQRAGIHYAQALAKAQPRPGKAELAQLRAAGFSRGAIVELTFAVASKSFKNRVATFLAV